MAQKGRGRPSLDPGGRGLGWQAVADPGFPRGGGTNPKWGEPTYYLANFSRKLHENEEILGQRGGARPSRPPLDPPLAGRG